MRSRKRTQSERRPSTPEVAGSGTSSPSGGSQIDPLYGAWAVEPSESSIDASDNVLARIDEAEAVLGGYLVKGVVSIGLVINPLLDVWDAAHCIDPGVSSPVEHLLTGLVARTWVSAAELTFTLDQVRAAALQASVLVDALTSPSR